VVLKARLADIGNENLKDFTIMEADSPDGMALALINDVLSTPALIDGDEAYTDLNEIVWALTKRAS
jgi:hypothetical protein